MKTFEQVLKDVRDSYDDFVICIIDWIEGDEDSEKKIMEYIEEHPSCCTSDVLEYIVDDLKIVHLDIDL